VDPATEIVAGPGPASLSSSGAPTLPVLRNETAPSQLPGVASQLVSVLAPLRSAPSGTQSLTISLHPADLGSVQATVVLHDGMLTVRLVASTPAGAAALHASLPDLQHGLEEGGQRSSVQLGDPGSGNLGNGSPGSGDPGSSGSQYATGQPSQGQAPARTIAATSPTGSVQRSSDPRPRLPGTSQLLDVRA
jgi:hypothetical protein